MLELINRNHLQSVMLADGVISLVAAVGLIAFAGPVAALIGPAVTPGLATAFGVFFIGWSALHFLAGRRAQPPRAAVRIAIAGDALWIAGSLAALFAVRDGLTTTGMVVIAIAAVAVADIMVLKIKGLGRAIQAT